MLIGRKEEVRALHEAFEKKESVFSAVYGRRRVGKTHLIREAFDYTFTFQHAGLSEGGMKSQLASFRESLVEAGLEECPVLKNWREAFAQLKILIGLSRKKKKVIFIDEIAWMDTPKSEFLPALESFWNKWASARKDILLIVCASATSWITNKVIHNKGGLHNRVTLKILLPPFTLNECEQYAKHLKLKLNRYQIMNLYMVIGGVAYYWSLLDRRLSAAQNIDHLFFGKGAALSNEFNELYNSLFKNPEPYKAIVTALGRNLSGLTRNELISKKVVKDNGAIRGKMEELEQCGFILKTKDFTKKTKGAVYMLVDNFTIFYYKFIRDNADVENFWTSGLNAPGMNSWTGLAFERVCLQHINQIKHALQIGAVACRQHSWRSDPAKLEDGQSGVQIDLLIDRADQVVNICEMKWSTDEYVITRKYDAELRNKLTVFTSQTKTRKAVHLTMVTTYGVKHNMYYDDIQSQVVMDQLFEKL